MKAQNVKPKKKKEKKKIEPKKPKENDNKILLEIKGTVKKKHESNEKNKILVKKKVDSDTVKNKTEHETTSKTEIEYMKNKIPKEISRKNEIENIKNKAQSELASKIEIQSIRSETIEKKKQIPKFNILKNEINKHEIDKTEEPKLVETNAKVEEPESYETFTSLIRDVDIDLKKNIKNVKGIHFSDELAKILFLNSHSTVVKKNHFFSLLQKYADSDELFNIKHSLHEYKLDEILLFEDSMQFYKSNFAMVIDEKTFHHLTKKDDTVRVEEEITEKNQQQIKSIHKKERFNYIFIKPKKYTCTDEEEIRKEIYATNILENRKKIKKLIYINKYRDIKKEKIELVDNESFISIKNQIPTEQTVKALTLDFFSSNSVILLNNSTQTPQPIFKSTGTQYNIEFLNKKKEEILESTKLLKFLQKTFPIIQKSIYENLIISQKEEQNKKHNTDSSSYKATKNLNKLFIYTDVKYTTDKVISFTLYLSFINYLIFIVYINNNKVDNYIEGVNTDSYILIWYYHNYISPLYALISPYQITSAIIKEKGTNFLVIAGCSNGMLVVWKLPPQFYEKLELDSKINEKTIDIEPYIHSSIEHTHKREVTSLHLLNDKAFISNEKKIVISNVPDSYLLISISVDGTILIWDATNIEVPEIKTNLKKKEKEFTDELYSFHPLFKINVTRPNIEHSLGFTYFHFMEINQNAASFFAFSEEGEYILGNLYSFVQKDKNYSIINKINDDHKNFKSLLCVKRNHILKYLLLSLTDTNFYLWKEDEEYPLFISPKNNEIYSCCEFSHTKIGVLFIGKTNGQIEIWNLNDQRNHCICSLTISSYSLTCISIFQEYNYQKEFNLTKNAEPQLENTKNTLENYEEFADSNEYLMSKNKDDAFKYSYNKIIIGDSSGCVFVYEIKPSLLNSTPRDIEKFLLWIENRIFLNKQKKKRHIELGQKEKTLNDEEKKTKDRKEQLKSKLDEDYKNIAEKYKNYLIGDKL